MANICRSALLLLAIVLLSFTATIALKPKVARFNFYMHDVVSGSPNVTGIRVAPARPLNLSNPNLIAETFGSIFVVDCPLTATPALNSTLIGRAQGTYAMSSQENELSILMSLTYMMVSGPFNGSTFTLVARNPIMQPIREMPIVGGTGQFRMARGYCLAQTVSMEGLNAVIHYNVTLLHY